MSEKHKCVNCGPDGVAHIEPSLGRRVLGDVTEWKTRALAAEARAAKLEHAISEARKLLRGIAWCSCDQEPGKHDAMCSTFTLSAIDAILAAPSEAPR